MPARLAVVWCRGHERVGLYLYSPSGPYWPVIGRTFTLYHLCCRAVIPKLGYAYPQEYESGHLGVREKINNGGKGSHTSAARRVGIYQMRCKAYVVPDDGLTESKTCRASNGK